MAQLPRAVRPFATGQYRLLFGALTLSLFGGGMWLVALVWQVIELGGGPLQLSITATATSIGMVGATLIGGVVADRVPQRLILVGIESVKVVSMAGVAALALTGSLELWHLVVAAALLGIGEGFFYPAYSAILPSLLPADDLLAANGIEGVLRPSAMQAAGPALAAGLIAIGGPPLAFVVIVVVHVLALVGLSLMRSVPVVRDRSADTAHPLVSVYRDMREGVVYMVRTPWLFATLLFAFGWVLVLLGPIEVLLPFAVRDQTGGGAGSFALVLAAFGVGGAIGSIFVASRPLPRRYLTVMLLVWGVGSVPMAIIGFTSELWVMAAAVFIVGFTGSAGGVIWGTLLQRRVPRHLLGRVSSLDFFVSLALMPVSMALAGPVGEAVGLMPTFLVAGIVPVFFAVAALLIARMPRDEIAHPLDATGPVDEVA
ncbi:MFS transporter [Agreia pratensis]|uniref:Predicted arabinose efflux permease, MFS family n=1 Tax=Agreia pratensis TaxID=150121 RepID=A0A1X7ISM4_9MICO|nr:MFS transporter [Agreia pratensis]SMG17757.1 Predicted arabinose efflux permease, MFS family [Agreia pratensis]